MTRIILLAVLLVGVCAPALAQSHFSPANGDPNQVPGAVGECLDSQGKAIPISAACAYTPAVAPSTGTGAYSAATVGASSGQVLAAGVAKVFLDLVNPSTTATIACAFGIPAVINGAGSITLPPLWHRSWPDGAGYVPGDVLNCIASAGSTPMTVGAK